MIEQLEHSVSSLADRLKDAEREIEGAYAGLDDLFPRLLAQADDGVRSARTSLEAIRTALGAGRSARVEDFLETASGFFDEIRERDKSFLTSVNAGIDRISALDKIIARVRTDSEEMELVSLNALTAALKSGSAGRAFSVITDELKKISFKTIAVTVDISTQGRKLLESFSSLGGILAGLSSLQESFFQDIRSALSGGCSALEARVRSAEEVFSALAIDAAGVLDRLADAPKGERELLGRSLEEVALSLSQTAKDADAPIEDKLVYTRAAAELSVSVLGDSIRRIDGEVDLLSGRIDAAAAVAEDADRRRKEAISGFEADQGTDPVAALEKAEFYLKLKSQALSASRDLARQVQQLNESFKILFSLLGKFQNIVVASRIEIARTRALAVVSNTVAGMIEITENLGRDVGQATEVTKTFIKTASSDILAYDKNQERNGERLNAAVRRMKAELEALETARERGKDAMASFRLYAPDFPGLIRSTRSALERLSELKTSLGRLRDELETLRRRAAKEAKTLQGDGGDGFALRDEGLALSLERFSVFARERTADGPLAAAVEEGAPPQETAPS